MHKKDKQIKLKDVLVYNINNILKIARKEEQKKKRFITNKKCKRPRKCLIKKIEKDNKNKNFKFLFNNSNIELEKCINRKTQSRKKE